MPLIGRSASSTPTVSRRPPEPGARMPSRTPMIAGIAPVLDRVGFHAVDFTSSTHMAIAVRCAPEVPVGADPGRPRPDARDEARLRRPRDALHGVVASADRRDAAGACLRDPKRCPPGSGWRGVDERRCDRPPDRRDRQGGGSRGDRARTHVLAQPRPRRRALPPSGSPRWQRQPATPTASRPQGPRRPAHP